MTYRIPLPEGSPRASLDIVEPNSTAVQRWLRRSGLSSYEPPTMAALMALFDRLEDGFVFFDVGANMGLYALMCDAIFTPDAVHAFEPAPASAAVARRLRRANRLDVEVFEVAVSDRNGRADLYLSARSDASNSLVPGFKRNVGSVPVETVRLDDHVRRTGAHPDVMKIDVETFEPAVLAGGAETITASRPHIVIEVLHRRGHDHGEEISAAMEPFGYCYYQLTDGPDWTPRPRVAGVAGSTSNDWLLAPEPLPESFAASVEGWRARLASCTPDRNSRVGLLGAAAAAARRGGAREVVSSARRYAAEILRRRG